jgi:A/G-specific adenine glycosylase
MIIEKLDQIPGPLLSWFAENARDLPWREMPGRERVLRPGQRSYHVWVSEIMLQQTRVEAVKPYYHRFMEALPDVEALARCPEDRLLKLWEGLGYYNRVRNMQKAAQIVTEQYGGILPGTYEELLALPGIGSYTAGAIASIAYGQLVPAVDGNVLRVISRITGSDADIAKQSVKTQFEVLLKALMEREFSAPDVPADRPGLFNQSLMELGATVCLPNGAPDCVHCPVGQICYANEEGCQIQLPVKSSQKARRIEMRTVFVIRDSERSAVRKRPARGLLAGLYELPNVEGHLTREQALEKVSGWGFSPIRITPLPEAKHIFSHIEWRMIGYMVLVEDLEEALKRKEGEMPLLFVEPQQTEREYPVPAAFAAYTKYLSIRLGQEKYNTEGEIE